MRHAISIQEEWINLRFCRWPPLKSNDSWRLLRLPKRRKQSSDLACAEVRRNPIRLVGPDHNRRTQRDCPLIDGCLQWIPLHQAIRRIVVPGCAFGTISHKTTGGTRYECDTSFVVLTTSNQPRIHWSAARQQGAWTTGDIVCRTLQA